MVISRQQEIELRDKYFIPKEPGVISHAIFIYSLVTVFLFTIAGTRVEPHESPHFCATLKSPTLGFPQAAGWRIIREGELCAHRRNDLISFMTS